MRNKKLNLKVWSPAGVRGMTVYSSYHGVMKSLRVSRPEHVSHGPGSQRLAVTMLSVFYFTSAAWPRAQQQPDAAPHSSPKRRPSMQLQRNPARSIKFATRLVPCSSVTQADARNLDWKPHLRDLLSTREVTTPHSSEPCSRGQPPVWEPPAGASRRLHLLPCSAGAACHISSSCRRNTNLWCFILAGKWERGLPKTDYPVSLFISHVLV